MGIPRKRLTFLLSHGEEDAGYPGGGRRGLVINVPQTFLCLSAKLYVCVVVVVVVVVVFVPLVVSQLLHYLYECTWALGKSTGEPGA